MFNTITTVILTLLLFIVFDLVWFSVSLTAVYQPAINNIQGFSTDFMSKMSGGIFAWFLLALGINIFVLPKSNTTMEAVINGMLFGFIVYGVFNGTNYVMFKNYDMNVFFPDLVWGTLVSGAIAGIIFKYRK